MRLRAISLNTFKEAVRNKIFYLLVFLGIFFALSSEIISLLTLGEKEKILKDIGLGAINFFGVLIAIFTGINMVYKEIEKKTIYNIMSKPISRSSFIIGKFFGLSLTLFVALLSMVIIYFLFFLLSTGELDFSSLIYFGFLYLELLIITSISLLFSSFTTPILASIFTICLYLIGHILWTFNEFKHHLVSTLSNIIGHFFYFVLPNLDKFNIRNKLVLGVGIEPCLIINAILYALIYISALLVLSIIIFNKREFK